jgi:hypothetical protein
LTAPNEPECRACPVPSIAVSTSPQPNPATVEALLDTTWRLTGSEASRTEALDRKSATLATFASLLTALLGLRFVEDKPTWWTLTLFTGNLVLLGAAVGLAVVVLLPREYLALGIEYLRRFPTRSEILKPPEQVRGETMRGLVEAIARERDANDGKARLVRWAYLALAAALVLTIAEAVTLGWNEVT